MIFFYFYLISFSLIGYGLLASKVLDININTIGFFGLLGISVLTLFSFVSCFVFSTWVFTLVTSTLELEVVFGVVFA